MSELKKAQFWTLVECESEGECDNCPSGDLATHTVIMLSGELALCESCYND